MPAQNPGNADEVLRQVYDRTTGTLKTSSAGGGGATTLDAGEAHIGAVGGQSIEVTDDFQRPNDATAYAANDRIASTTSNTGTTPLRGLALLRVAAGTAYLTYWRLVVDHTTFLATIRVHLFKTAAPATAVNGDNAAFVKSYANNPNYIGSFDLPTLALPAGADMVETVRDDLRLPIHAAGGDTNIYYALEILAAATPAALKHFYSTVRADVN